MTGTGGRIERPSVVRSLVITMLASFGLVVPSLARAQQPVGGQAISLSLADALRRAEAESEQVAIARAGVLRSSGELRRARSEYFPQIFGTLSYTRTLDSEFAAFAGEDGDTTTAPAPEPCGTFTPNPALPLNQRVDSLEAAVRCASEFDPFSAFRNLPFGRENQWQIGLSVSQTLFAGGRVRAQNRAARAGRDVAQMDLTSARAQLMLDVAEAYFDAVLAGRLLAIAEATLNQAEETLSQVRLATDVGNQPEFELLRAQVTRDAQRPIVIQRRSTRDLAYLRLKQLLDLPPAAPLELTTGLEDAETASLVRLVTDLVGIESDTMVDRRVTVRQAASAVTVQEAQLTIARAQRLPSLSLSMQYGRVGYPETVSPFDVHFRTNWTIGASLQLPIFTGGRLSGESMIARANLEEARSTLELTRELAALDTRSAIQQLEAARASLEASEGTVQQAERAYSIAQVRFREGISTQLELTDSRILLQQAQANRAQASRDLQVAELRMALLPWLPLDSFGTTPLPTGTVTTPQQQITPPVPAQPQQTITGGITTITQAAQVRN